MYYLDPAGGRKRRELVRDKLKTATSGLGDALDATGRNMSEKAKNLAASARSHFKLESISDRILAARVRSRLGRNITYSKAIEVEALNGVITLRGPVLINEVDRLLSCAGSVSGVNEVCNELEVHESALDSPALQGPSIREGEKSLLLQKHWSPAFRLLMGSLGAGVLALSRGRGAMKVFATPVGLGLLAKAMTNADFAELAGFAADKTRDIAWDISSSKPVETVKEMFH